MSKAVRWSLVGGLAAAVVGGAIAVYLVLERDEAPTVSIPSATEAPLQLAEKSVSDDLEQSDQELAALEDEVGKDETSDSDAGL